MKIKDTVGIDVSKRTIDVAIYRSQLHHQFENNLKGYNRMLKWLKSQLADSIDHVLICFEHTGIYSLPLACYFDEKRLIFCMVNALDVKRSLGLVRGKNDQVDAYRIAEYAYLRKHKLPAYQLPSRSLLMIQKLLSLRDRLIRQKSGYQGSLKESKEFLNSSDHQMMISIQKKTMLYLAKQIELIEERLLELIRADAQLNKLYELITSVRGAGMILAANLLVTTNGFTRFDNSRKFSCYAGIAPFEKQSGSSLKTKARVSHLANKKIKTLLNMAAASAIVHDAELKAYYHRKLEQGKSKMSSINIIRNKIVHRIFAVVKRETPYVSLNNYQS